jgi:hypothetical protein
MQRWVAVCRDCSDHIGEPAVRAFEGVDAMDTWMGAHIRGHHVRSLPGHPSPEEAYARAFGEGT